jgi:hypothetical protein
VLGGCGGEPQGGARAAAERAELRAYLARVEPIRRGVNRLLEGADPITTAYHERRLSAAQARRRFATLTARFAAFKARIAAIRPVPAALRAAQNAYSRTYVLEHAYLRAIAAAIPSRDFGSLPHTAAAQRKAILAWRHRLHAVANRLGVTLPADVDLAGRGEIAPSPFGE